AGTVNGAAVDFSKIQRLMAVVQVGAVGGGPGTVDAKLQSNSKSDFSGTTTNLSGASITQISSANKIATIECRADQLPAGDRYVRLVVTVGVNAVLIAAVVLGGEAEYK